MYALLVLGPIIIALLLMVIFRLSAAITLPVAYAGSVIVALVVWKVELKAIFAMTILGSLSAVDILFIIAGAIFLLNVLNASGCIEVINRFFSSVSKDRRVQVLIIGYMFCAFIEGAAGFGTPAALAAPLLVALGFPLMAAAMITLICNSAPVCFGAVGVPTITAVSVVQTNIKATGMDPADTAAEIYGNCAILMGIAGIIVPILAVSMMVFFFEGNYNSKIRAILEVTPLALLSGISFSATYIAATFFMGPELPSIIGSIVGLAVLLFAIKFNFLIPDTCWEFKENVKTSETETIQERIERDKKEMSLLQAAAPYLIIAIILLVTRLPQLGLKDWIARQALVIPNILGYEDIAFSWKWLNNPGIFPFILVAVCLVLLYRKRLSVKGIASATFNQIKTAAIALVAGVSLVKVLQFSYINNSGMDGMLTETAKIIADILGQAYPLAAPLIGVIGAFVSGSCTVSNTLFSALQFDTAHILGLPVATIVAMQSAGAAIGNMVCVNNVVAACATTGAIGCEGKIILRNMIPIMILYCMIVVETYLLFL